VMAITTTSDLIELFMTVSFGSDWYGN